MAILAAAVTVGCTDGPTAAARDARVVMSFLTPATVRTVVVEVSGPGLSPPVVVNIPVGADSTVRDTLMLTAGSGRRFVVTALDSAGVTTHRADTTITLQAGGNAPLAMRLDPLTSTLGITVTFGGVRITVPDTNMRTLVVGDSLRIPASASNPSGLAVSASELRWAASNPAIVTAEGGLLRAVRAGLASIVVSTGGAAVQISVRVINSDTAEVASTDNIFGVGASAPSPGGGGGGTLASVLNIGAGVTQLTVTPAPVNAGVGSGPADSWNGAGPDGNSTSGMSTNIPSVGPISGLQMNLLVGPIVGVFLPAGDISALPPPPALSYTLASIRSVSFSPGLRQVFFIGDGFDGQASFGPSTGTVQRFMVPAGASKLVIGVANACFGQGAAGCYNALTPSAISVVVTGYP